MKDIDIVAKSEYDGEHDGERDIEMRDGVLHSGGRPVKALVLAAGEGTRLRPLTQDRPKPMLPIAGQPLLGITLAQLRSVGIWEAAINLHHRPQQILDYVGDGSPFGLNVTYLYEPELLGSAGAARELQQWTGDAVLLLVYGDILTNLSYGDLLRHHARSRAAEPRLCGTLGLRSVDNPTECGIVELNDAGRVMRYLEKPMERDVFSRLAHAGVSILEPHALHGIAPDAVDFGLDVFPTWIADGKALFGWRIPESAYHIDIGSHERYERAQREWRTI